jgi:hypothetical protein
MVSEMSMDFFEEKGGGDFSRRDDTDLDTDDLS